MLIELIGGPSDGHVVTLEPTSSPGRDIRVPVEPPPPAARPWDVHQTVSDEIPMASYRLTVKPYAGWVYVYTPQYERLTRRWRP
jgi:hypothetical protein